MEHEIFGDAMPFRAIQIQGPEKTVRNKGETPTIYGPDVYELALDSFQSQKYRSAVFLKRYDIISRFNSIIESSTEAKSKSGKSDKDSSE